jgi:hypothetical protein
MTRAFDKIAAGFEEAIAYAEGDRSRGQAIPASTEDSLPPSSRPSPNPSSPSKRG